MKPRCHLHERLSAHRALFGLLQTYPNMMLTEMAGMCGYDFLLLDGEHGLFSEHDYFQALQVLDSVDVISMVRLAGHDTQALGRYLDMGADVIIVPNVTTSEQAKALVRAMEYPPSGTRGFGAPGHRVTRYGLDLAEHLNAPREGASLIVMIESALGVSNVEAIVAVEGIDGVLIGPSDLVADLGCERDFNRSAYVEALARIEQAAAVSGKFVGTVPHASNPLEALLARGHRFFILGAEVSLIREAMRAQVMKARSHL
jgi:4-hydroxy-2-oxoheptanedioate aldolase